ncbi:outer membrane lipoprotein chaperone LolA [Bacteroidota bacterium]
MKNVFVLLVILFTASLHAQDAEVILNDIQKKFQTIQDLKAGFNQSAKDNAGRMQFENTGTFNYKKPNKFRIELDILTIISDNESLWNYDKNQNRVLINYVSDEPSSFSFERYIMEYPSQCDVSIVNEANGSALLLIPVNLNMEFNSVKLWHDKNYIVNRIEIVDLNDLIITITLNNIVINQSLPESKFNFTPPKGSQVIDLR